MVNEQLVSLNEAAKHLSLKILDFTRYRSENSLPYKVVEGKPFFNLESIVDCQKPNYRSKEKEEVIEETRKKEIIDENGNAHNEIKDFFLSYIENNRNQGYNGIHAVYSGFNEAFREQFPNHDLFEEQRRLKEEGIIKIGRVKGGVLLFDNLENSVQRELKSNITIPEDSTYDYEDKNYWRRKWHNFWDNNIEDKKNAKVLFLAGYGDEIPGYLERGIPLENLVAIERIPQLREQLKQQYLNLEIHPDLEQYLKSSEESFGIVSLDYMGHISREKINHLELMITKELLDEKSVIGINLLGNREKREEQDLYLEPIMEVPFQSFSDNGWDYKDENIERIFRDCEKNIKQLRDYGLNAIMKRLLLGKNSVEINYEMIKYLSKDKQKEILAEIEKNDPQDYMDFLSINEQIRYSVMQEVNKLSSGFNNPGNLKKVAMIIDAHHSKPHFINEELRVSYLSRSKNNTYNSEFLALDQYQISDDLRRDNSFYRLANGKKKLINFLIHYDKLDNKQKKKVDRLIRIENKVLADRYSNMFISESDPKRILLDRGYHVREMINEGCCDTTIMDQIPGLKVGSLRAYKANITRGNS